MPGLVGIIASESIHEESLDKMIGPLMHQERYQIDKFVSGSVGLARVHLGIYNGAKQPSFSSNGSISVLFDGKIYGNQERAMELRQNGAEFDAGNDAEFCLKLYQETGAGFVKELNGNFIVCIHDQNLGRTILANDRFGFRVHYYSCTKERFLFGPEPKAILNYPGFARELDEEAVIQFFSLGEFWQGVTWFKGINMLPPASLLTYQDGEMKIEQYWKLNYNPDRSRTEQEFVTELVKRFKKAVKVRLEDNLRHGVTLSGGLDSRSVAAAIPREKRGDVIACTFGNPESDEVKIAAKVVEKLGLKSHLVLDTPPELIINNAVNDVALTDGRLYLGLAFVYPVFQRIVKEVDVIFDGFALDLTLGGSYLSKEKMEVKDRNQLLSILARKRRFNENQLEQLFTRQFYNTVKRKPGEIIEREFQKVTAKEGGDASDEFAMNGHVAWMHIGDVAVRANVEVSHPTSDNDLIDLITQIPAEYRANHRIYRKFLISLSAEASGIVYDRTMVRADAPLFLWRLGVTYAKGKEFAKKRIQILSGNRRIMRNKRSYVAFNEWFRTNKEWQEFFRMILLEASPVSSKYIDQDYIRKILAEQESGLCDHSMNLLHIATFKLLVRQYFESDH